MRPASAARPSAASRSSSGATAPALPAGPSSARRWPPSVTCEPPPAGPESRVPMASVTWSATVRPKRASHACGIGSEFTIVPVASPSPMRAPEGFESVSVCVSSPSSMASSSTGTSTVFSVTPAAKLSVPLVPV